MDTTYNDNQSGLVIKRQVQVEAISKAIYLVTDLFKNDEPLKMSLRRVAVNIIENEDKTNSLLKLKSLIKLSNNTELITDMNADLLIRVIDSHLNDLNKKEEKKIVVLDKVLSIESVSETEKDINEIVVFENKEKVEFVTEEKIEKKTPTITIHNNTQNIKTINNISMDIGSRRKRILEIVKSRGAVTINEFIESIKGISSKTIQRELTSLVLSGTLKKTGERRWSKYSLK
jgi:hypothetical protein